MLYSTYLARYGIVGSPYDIDAILLAVLKESKRTNLFTQFYAAGPSQLKKSCCALRTSRVPVDWSSFRRNLYGVFLYHRIFLHWLLSSLLLLSSFNASDEACVQVNVHLDLILVLIY